jgi:hypothetical protein
MAGIPITLNFDLKAPLPLDSRLVVANTNQLNNINPKYSGMIVYAANTQKLYYLENLNTNTWSQLGTGSSINANLLNNIVYTTGNQTINGSKTFIATGFYYSGGLYRYDKHSRTVFEENVFINKINNQTSFGIYNYYTVNNNSPISGQLSNLPVGIRTGNIVNLFFNNSGLNNSLENQILVQPTVMIKYTGNVYNNDIIPIINHQYYSKRALKKINYGSVIENIVYTTGNQTISGIKTFRTRPTVNGTGVLLSGEIPTLPNGIVYTTGVQSIQDEKTFKGPTNFENSMFVDGNKWLYHQFLTGFSGDNSDYTYFGWNLTSNNNGTIMFVSSQNFVYTYLRNSIQNEWSFSNRFGVNGSVNELHFNEQTSSLFVGVTTNQSGEAINIYTGNTNIGWNNLARIITGYGSGVNNRFGFRIKTNNNANILVTSADSDGEKGVFAGAAFVYTGSLTNGWNRVQKILPSGSNRAYLFFGENLDLTSDGNILFESNYTEVNVFTKNLNNSSYTLNRSIRPDSITWEEFTKVSCNSDGSRFVFAGKNTSNPNAAFLHVYTGDRNIGWNIEQIIQDRPFTWDSISQANTAITKDGNIIILGGVGWGGQQGSLSVYSKNLLSNTWNLSEVIQPNLLDFALSVRIGVAQLGTEIITSQDGSFVGAGGPFAPIVQGGTSRGYFLSLRLTPQSIIVNSQQPNSSLLTLDGQIDIFNKRPRVNNTGILLKGEAVEPDSDARLNTLKFKNTSEFDSPYFLSNYISGGTLENPNLPDLTIYSDFAGDLVKFTTTGANFYTRPKVNGSGVLLQGESANVSLDPFNGNRSITIDAPGFKNVNAGGTTISGFLNNLFFPFVPASILLNPYSLQELGTTYVQVPFNGTITQNSEIQISNLQYMIGDIVLNTIPSPAFGNFSTNFTLNLTNDTNVRARVTTSNNGSQAIITGSQLISFIAPSWYGVGVNGIITGVKNMTKYLNTKANRTFTFNTANNHFYYAYPNDWGLLSSIIDQNGFNITSSFSNTTGNLVLANNITNYTYRIYQSVNPSTNTNFNITFNF